MPVIPMAITARNRKLLPWAEFVASLDETPSRQKNNFDPLHIITEKYGITEICPTHVVRFTVSRNPGTQPLADALVVIRDMYRKQSRKGFRRQRPLGCPDWRKVVITPEFIDRRCYESFIALKRA